MIISTAHSLGNEREQGKIMLAESFSKCPNVRHMFFWGTLEQFIIPRYKADLVHLLRN